MGHWWGISQWGLTMGNAFGFTANVVIFYVDMLCAGMFGSDALLVHEFATGFINGLGGIVFVATDVLLPAQGLIQVSQLPELINNVTTPEENADVYFKLTSEALQQQTLTTPGAVALVALSTAYILVGAINLYYLVWTRQHTVHPEDVRCKHMHANAKGGNFVSYSISGHLAGLSTIILIMLSAASVAKCTGVEIEISSGLVAQLRDGMQQGNSLGEELVAFNAVMNLATLSATSKCSVAGQASNMLSFFVMVAFFFQGYALDRKVATMASILDNKAHPMVMVGARAIFGSAIFAFAVLFVDALDIGGGASWAKLITSWSSML